MLTREQYIAFLDGKPLEQIVSSSTTPPAKPPQQPPRGPTQKEKDALLASLAAQKDTFPSTLLTLIAISIVTPSLIPFLLVEQLIKCAMCNKSFDDPRTLPCLHSFCLGCLEVQKFTAMSKSSDLRCHQCRAPFTPPTTGGVGAYTCNAFIDSLVKSAKANEGDINRVVKCELCEDEDATVHCVDCNEHIGPTCLIPHKKGKATATHQQIPLEEALAGNATAKKIPRCQEHIGMEIDTHCKTCKDSICARCILANHRGHEVCPLDEVTGPLQDQIAGYTITITKREEEARKAITSLDDTINKIEEHRTTAEKEIDALFASIHTATDARHAQVLQQMHDKGDQLRKTAIQEKGEAESATVEFREFHSFTEGLLAQGTPLEIAGTHKIVRA